jgi:hypothetical protein
MRAVWASHHEELCSDDIMAPHLFAPLVDPERGGVLDAATHALRAERTAEGSGVDVLQALAVSPGAPCMHAQRVARFDP